MRQKKRGRNVGKEKINGEREDVLKDRESTRKKIAS